MINLSTVGLFVLDESFSYPNSLKEGMAANSICMNHIIKQIAQQQESITDRDFQEVDSLDNTTLL